MAALGLLLYSCAVVAARELAASIERGQPPDGSGWWSRYAEACDRSRVVVAATPSLDDLSVGTSSRTGNRWDLRWVLLHMIEETARHAGHLDVARELIDGRTGLGPR